MNKDFGHDLCGRWENGSFPKCDKVFAVVEHDLKHHKYIIKRTEIDDFKHWVIAAWCASSDHLDEIEYEKGEDAFFEQVRLNFFEIEKGDFVEWEYNQ